MEKETLFIAFSTQKGGAGKTTLTVLVASYLHYVKGMNVAVVDCDYPQHSIAEMRKRDLKTVMEDEHYKLMAYRQLQRIRKKAYPIAESTAEDAVAKADELLEKMPETDIVFFDLPGTVNSTGVLNTLVNMDYVFSPIAADRVVMESTLRFASRLNDTLIATGKTNIKGLYLLWNMVDGREKSELYKVYEQVISELGLKVLNTFLPDSKRFRRELTGEHRALFRSTLFPADGTLVKGRRKQPGIRDSPVKRADMSVCSSTSHRSAHGLARQSTFVRSSMNGFRRLSRQSGTTRCPFSAMWTMCWNSTFPPIRTRLRRNTENEVPNCFKPRKSCQQSYSYLPAAICCG